MKSTALGATANDNKFTDYKDLHNPLGCPVTTGRTRLKSALKNYFCSLMAKPL
jgi:hypothetical protein